MLLAQAYATTEADAMEVRFQDYFISDDK